MNGSAKPINLIKYLKKQNLKIMNLGKIKISLIILF